MADEKWCRQSKAANEIDCEYCREQVRAPLSTAAEVFWARLADEPGEYLVIEVNGERVSLTRDEVEVLARLFRHDPQYYLDPFYEVECPLLYQQEKGET